MMLNFGVIKGKKGPPSNVDADFTAPNGTSIADWNSTHWYAAGDGQGTSEIINNTMRLKQQQATSGYTSMKSKFTIGEDFDFEIQFINPYLTSFNGRTGYLHANFGDGDWAQVRLVYENGPVYKGYANNDSVQDSFASSAGSFSVTHTLAIKRSGTTLTLWTRYAANAWANRLTYNNFNTKPCTLTISLYIPDTNTTPENYVDVDNFVVNSGVLGWA